MKDNQTENQKKTPSEKCFWFTISGLIALIIIGIIGYYLIAEHGAHIAGFFAGFPWILLILLCPLMHIFMHGGHGHSKHHDRNKHTHEKKD